MAVGVCALLLLVHSFLLQEDAVVTPVCRALVDGLNIAMLATLFLATATSRSRNG